MTSRRWDIRRQRPSWRTEASWPRLTEGASRSARLAPLAARAGAISEPVGGLVAPQRLHGEGRAAVALDVAQRARDRGHVAGAGQRFAHPCALVAILVGVQGVVPGAKVLGVQTAAVDVLGARIGDRLLDLVAEDDRET